MTANSPTSPVTIRIRTDDSGTAVREFRFANTNAFAPVEFMNCSLICLEGGVVLNSARFGGTSGKAFVLNAVCVGSTRSNAKKPGEKPFTLLPEKGSLFT